MQIIYFIYLYIHYFIYFYLNYLFYLFIFYTQIVCKFANCLQLFV